MQFSPDQRPDTPGALVMVSNMVPTARGYAGAPAGEATGKATLAAAARSMFIATDLSGTRRLYVGTNAALYEDSTGTWADRSAVGGYNIGAGNRWSITQFGNTTIAAAKAQTLQAATGGAFAAVSGAPKASWCDASGGFVMLADTNDGTYGDQSDRWWCCAYQDYATWTPSVSTQATTGRLVESPGAIKGLKALGSGFVAYKQNGIFVGSYVGAPDVWRWDRVPGDLGTVHGHGIVSIGSAHAFVGPDNLYLFDGSRPVPIGDAIREWWYKDVNWAATEGIVGAYDPIEARIWWHYTSRGGGSLGIDKAIVYDLRTARWGVVSLAIEAAGLVYISPVTYDELGSVFATYDDLTTSPYDSAAWGALASRYSYVDTSHVVRTLTAPCASCSMTTHNYGDDDAFTTVTRVRPRFLRAPATAVLEHLYDDAHGDSFTSLGTMGLWEDKFDTLWSSRWHRFVMAFTGDVEVAGITISASPDGDA